MINDSLIAKRVLAELAKKVLNNEQIYKTRFVKHCVCQLNGLGASPNQICQALDFLESKKILVKIKSDFPFILLSIDLSETKIELKKSGQEFKSLGEQFLKISEQIEVKKNG